MARKKAEETPEQDDLHAEWLAEIERYDQEAEKWVQRGKKIIKRYKDDRAKNDGNVRFNILWSNVQVLKPALYAKDPIPRVDQRFKDKNPVARVGADILRKCLSYAIECTGFGGVVRQALQDRLLPGRGATWVRYVPTFRKVQVTDDEEAEELAYEEVTPDYVHWEDFGHTFARTWEELRGVWRIVYMTRPELKERFGEELGEKIPLDYRPEDKKETTKVTDGMKKACIYEIWDKQTKTVIWLSKEHPQILEQRDDPLGLEEFFPCPPPLLANLANDTLIPVPDYWQYQDQAGEIDELTCRIANISKSIKVAGVYDSRAEGINRIFTEGVENTLIPIAQWTQFAERGGLKSAMDLIPTSEMSKTLNELIMAREKAKTDLYEITGLSDIIRGFSGTGAKTATEQKIKSQFANLRLSEQQKEVQQFCRNLLKIMGEIMAAKFAPESLLKISGVKLMTEAEKEQAKALIEQQTQQFQQLQQQHQQMAQQAQQTGQPPPEAPKPPQVPPELTKALKDPSVEQVMKLLRNHAEFGFSIEIETDSTIATDKEADKEQANNLITAIGSFAQGMAGALQQGLITQEQGRVMLVSVVKKHNVSKDVEEVLDEPVPTQQGNQQMQQQQQKLQQEMQKLQQERQKLEQDKMAQQSDGLKSQAALQQKDGDLTLREQKLKLEAEAQALEQDKALQKIQAAIANAKAMFTAASGEAKATGDAKQAQDVKQGQAMVVQAIQEAVAALMAPKQIIRGADGRAEGIAPAIMPNRMQ